MKTNSHFDKLDELVKSLFPSILAPLTKIIGLFSYLFMIFYSSNFFLHLTCLIISFIFSFLLLIDFEVSLHFILTSLAFTSLFSAGLIWFSTLFIEISEPFHLFILVENRLISSLYLFTWFFASVSSYELFLTFNRLHFPPSLTWLIVTIYQFIPILSKEISTINNVRKLKGLTAKPWKIKEYIRVIKKTLKPMIIVSVNQGIEHAEMLLLKGFMLDRRMDQVIQIKMKYYDYIVAVVSFSLIFLTIFFL